MEIYTPETLISLIHSGLTMSRLVQDDGPIQDGVRQEIRSNFMALSMETANLGLSVAFSQIEDILKILEFPPSKMEGLTVNRSINLIVRTIHTELSKKLFLEIDEERHKLVRDSSLFGDEVAKKFPSASYDIDEAGKCLALDRHTACVFHLMRVMEIGIRGTARCLGIPDPIKQAERNWGTVLRKIKEEIDVISKGATKRWRDDKEKAFFEDTLASLDAVRNAWRNTTMHVENQYSDEDADNIYRSVRFSIRKLASRFDESGEPKVQ